MIENKKPRKRKKPVIEKPASKSLVIKAGKDSKGRFLPGNQVWKLWDGKNGNPRLFDSPEHLWKESLKYFEYCENNPIIEIDFKGKDADRVRIPRVRAFTWQALELFLGIDSLREYKVTYSEFSKVITHIGKIIYTQKFEHAAAGMLNPNIIASDLGLRTQTHMTLDDDRKVVGDLFPDVLDGENN